jgi:hypothetical protein
MSEPNARAGTARIAGAIDRHGLTGVIRRVAAYSAKFVGKRARGWSDQTARSLHFAGLRLNNSIRRRTGVKAVSQAPVYLVINVDTEGPSSVDKNADWAAIEREITSVLDPAFRANHVAGLQRPLVLSWFVVDWIGVQTRCGRALGYHAVFDRYQHLLQQARVKGIGDELYWHYHHALPDHVESNNRDWLKFPEYERIISRRLLERGFYASCYRAGNTWEDAVVSRWLERWLPFDFSNRAPQRGRNFDWSRAPSDWIVYHPDSADVQRRGTQRRLLGRSVSIENGWFRREEVERAFLVARTGRPSYLSFFTHDYKPLRDYVEQGLREIDRVAKDFPGVPIEPVSARELFRRLSSARAQPFALRSEHAAGELTLRASSPIFGEQPWLAVTDERGETKRLDFKPNNRQALAWSIDANAIERAHEAAAAAASPSGDVAVLRIKSR